MDHLEQELKMGNQKACEALFDEYASSLTHLAYTFLFQAAEAEDVVQDCLLSFISALQNGSYRREKGTIEHYLRQSVRNRCIDRLRKRSEFYFSLDDLEMLPQEAGLSAIELPSEWLEDKRVYEEIQQAIQELSPMQRTVMVLRVLEGFSYQDIATELNISLNHVKNLMGRARQRLCKRLQPLLAERESS